MPKAHFCSQVISDSLKAEAEKKKKKVWKKRTLLQYNVSAESPRRLGLCLAPVLSEGSGNIWSSTSGARHTQGCRQEASVTVIVPRTWWGGVPRSRDRQLADLTLNLGRALNLSELLSGASYKRLN